MHGRPLASLVSATLLLMSACDAGPPTDSSIGFTPQGLTATSLTAGQTVHFLAAPTGGQLLFSLEVPANQNAVTFTTTGGPGNADMQVAFEATPTASNAACTSAQSGSAETCTVAGRGIAGRWYVLLTATSAFSNVTLTGDHQAGPTNDVPVQPLSLGQPVSGVSGPVGGWLTYSLQVPSGQSALSVALSGGTGDADLYLRQGSLPTLTEYTCRSSTPGNAEGCTASTPQEGTWYVLLRGYKSFSGTTLSASVTPATQALVNGQPVTGLSAPSGALRYFTLDVPAGHNLLKVTLAGGTGDADLYVRHGAMPTTSLYTCRSQATGPAETCSLQNPQAGTWHIMVRAYSAFSGVTLLATASDGLTGLPLVNGQGVSNLSSSGDSPSLFRLDVPADVAQVRFDVPAGATGHFTLYVKRGSEPTTTVHDCKGSNSSGSTVGCLFNLPQAGPWYVLLKPASPSNAYSQLTLVGRYLGVVRNVVLGNNQPVPDLSATADDSLYASLEVPAGQRLLAVWMAGGSGEPRLYARPGSRPTTSTYSCSTYVPGTCFIENPQAGPWHFLVRGAAPYSGHTLTAGTLASFPVTAALESGQPTPALSGSPLDVKTFTLEVPPNQARLRFTVEGGAGGTTVRAKRGSAPTLQSADCAGTCQLDAPGAGTWYVSVWSTTPYSGVTLTGTYTPPELLGNFASKSLPLQQDRATQSGNHYYRIEVPAGRNGLSFETSGIKTDKLSLYVKRGALPSPTDNDCASAIADTSEERCDFFDPQEGIWYALVTVPSPTSPTTFTSYVFAGHSETGPIAALADGVPVHVTGEANSFQTYRLELPAGLPSLQAEYLDKRKYSWAGSEFMIQYGAPPTRFAHRCRTSTACVIPTPEAGTWYVTVRGTGPFDGALRLTSNPQVRQMANGVWEHPLGGNRSPGAMTFFKLEVPAGASHLNVRVLATELNARAADVYVRYGALPSTWDYTCRVLSRPPEEDDCDVPQPQAGTWYVGVNEFDGPSLTRLMGTHAMTPGEGVPELASHTTLTGLSGPTSSQRVWKMEVPPGQQVLWFSTTGKASLRMKLGSRPTDGAATGCTFSYTEMGQMCFVPNPAAGTWFVSLFAADTNGAYENATLTGGFVSPGTVTPLNPTVPMPGLLVGGGVPQYFQLEVPPGQAELTFDVRFSAQDKGSLVAHLARGALPTLPATPCQETVAGIVRCQVLSPEGGTWFLRLADTGFSHSWTRELQLVGAYGPQVDDARVILNGLQVRGLSGSATTSRTFKLMVPEGARNMRVAIGTDGWPAYGIVTVAARRGSPPTATERACVSTSGTQTSCQVYAPEPGLWYVTVTPSAGYNDMWLFVDAR